MLGSKWKFEKLRNMHRKKYQMNFDFWSDFFSGNRSPLGSIFLLHTSDPLFSRTIIGAFKLYMYLMQTFKLRGVFMIKMQMLVHFVFIVIAFALIKDGWISKDFIDNINEFGYHEKYQR